VHAGSSQGNVINKPPIPYSIDTVYNVFEREGVSWAIFHDTLYTPSLTQLQFFKLWDSPNIFRFGEFQTRCNRSASAPPELKLPKYSFVEPRFVAERELFDRRTIVHSNDYHPPNNVIHGEDFVAKVYDAIRTCPYRDRILFVITFDEHGGTYDHVPPPSNAQPPNPDPVAKNGFDYSRFGVRVPAIVISDYVQRGIVFRSPSETPYDHTSILATLRDWLGLNDDPFFADNPRITAAPTLTDLIGTEKVDEQWPVVAANWGTPAKLHALATVEEDLTSQFDLPADDLEQSIVGIVDHYVRYKRDGVPPPPAESHLAAMAAEAIERLEQPVTRRDAIERLREKIVGKL
jgi:phospholipase C